MEEEEVIDDCRDDTLSKLNFTDPLKQSILLTSPAEAAKPETHRAARRLLKEDALAVQQRTANRRDMDIMSAARFPNLTATGTQKRFPSPSRRKLNYLEISTDTLYCLANGAEPS